MPWALLLQLLLMLFPWCFVCIASTPPPLVQKKHVMDVYPASRYNRTITIGVPISYDITDKFYSQGYSMLNAWQLYIEWVNNKGGILLNGENVSVTLKYIEDYSSEVYTISAVQYLLSEEISSDFFMSSYSSFLTNVTASKTEPKQKLLMAGVATNTAVFEGKQYTFGTFPESFWYVTAAFRSLSHLEAPRVAFLRDDGDPTCKQEIVSEVSALYPEVILYGYYDLDPTAPEYLQNIRTILEDLKANDVEAVVGCSFLDLCIQIPSISKNIDYNPDGMLFVICDDVTEVIETLGDDIEYMLSLVPWVSSVNNVDDFVGWSSTEFASKYLTAYSIEPTDVAASAFAALEILIASIESTQSLDSDVLAAELVSRPYHTFYANISFGTNHMAVLGVLVRQARFNNSVLDAGLIIDPPEMATVDVVWPVPSWKERSCVKDTHSCSSHGVCTRAGECICEPQYFGSTPETPCDSFCVGEIATSGQCHKDRIYYIGGIVDFSGSHADEVISTLNLAVELINNHTNGWFDSTRQVTLVLKIEDAVCGISSGEDAVKKLNDWAINVSDAGTTLDGLIGECSDSSKGAARFGNTIFLPHISYYATSVDLSDKDEYIYFARTCYTDEIHGELLMDVIDDVGVTPYLAVIHGPGSFLTSLAKFTAQSYEEKGHIILLQLEFIPTNNTADYADLLDTLAATGSPATVLVMSATEVEKVITAASTHPLFQDDAMVWVGIENWVDDSDTAEWNRQGMLGIVSPHVVTGVGGMADAYLELWESLDPEKYSDSDGDRTSVYAPSLCLVDAVFALALAFQQAIEEESGLEGDLLKRHTFSILTDEVVFDGVSGTVDFLNNGNRDLPEFGIVNYGISAWIDNGYIDGNGGTHVADYSSFLWPDGSSGKLNGNIQQELYCPAGTESKTSVTSSSSSSLSSSESISIATCVLCEVGFYSSYAGKEACESCPEGAICADVGVIIPCIKEGYWRAEPEDSKHLGDFNNYPVYSCDIVHGCEGGCHLNDTCASGRDPASVTCGVCLENYYLNYEGDCLECISADVYTPSAVILVYAAALILVGMLYCVVLVVLIQSFVKPLLRNSSSHSQEETNQSTGLSKLALVVKSVRIVSTNARAKITQQNFRDAMITGKIILAFLQVMGAFFLLDISWHQATDIFTSYNINVFRGNEHVVACSKVSNYVPSYYFIVLNAFFLPLVLCLLFAIITGSVYHYYRLQNLIRFQQHESLQQTILITDLLFIQVSSIFSRVVLWLCLLIYPSVCSIMLSVFNCRDFGNSGTFLRIDNSVSCENAEYDVYLSLAVLGILFYVAGIPCLFFFVIRRHLQLKQEDSCWESSARFLHHGFVAEWKYYEIFELLRKLLLTSVSQFVASPSSSSQVLYLLLVNCAALFFSTNAKPYINSKDNFLSTFLTFVECCAFLLALLVISDITETEGYDKTALFNTLLVLIFVGMFAVAPYTFIMKIDYFRDKLQLHNSSCCSGKSNVLVSRLSASYRMREDIKDLRESVVELERQSNSVSLFSAGAGVGTGDREGVAAGLGARLELTECFQKSSSPLHSQHE